MFCYYTYRLVEVLKCEKPSSSKGRHDDETRSAKTSRSLGELERTISALKSVIEKLQDENKRLKIRPSNLKPNKFSNTGSEKLKVNYWN